MLVNQKGNKLQTLLMNDNEENNYSEENFSDNEGDRECACSSTWWWVSIVLIGLLMVALVAAMYMLWACKRSTGQMESVMIVDPTTTYFNDFQEQLEAQLRGDL